MILILKKDEYLYYIPFNLLNNDIDSFVMFDRIDNIRVNIKTEDNNHEGKLYIKNMNIFSIYNKMGRLQYQRL